MNWTSFMITLVLAYLAYYGLNLLFDLLIGRKQPAGEDGNDVLFFEEHTEPELVTYEEQPEPAPIPQPSAPAIGSSTLQAIASGLIEATGAVGLKQLFNLAKDDLIEHTRAIPY